MAKLSASTIFGALKVTANAVINGDLIVDGEINADIIDQLTSDVNSLQSDKLDSADYNPESDTHSKYTDGEARSAIESGDVDHVSFSNIESVNDGQIGRDNSIGFLGEWAGHGNAVLWDSYNVNTDGDITVSGGRGDESNPQIGLSNNSVTVAGNSVSLGGSTAINHSDLSNVGSSDHHAKYTDNEAVSALENNEAIPHKVYASKSDVPSLNKGDVAYIDGDGLYVEDGT